jgi:hypothetical protein
MMKLNPLTGKFDLTSTAGPQGAKGDTGTAGAKGDTGTAGAKGDTGAAGAKGDTGSTGPAGYAQHGVIADTELTTNASTALPAVTLSGLDASSTYALRMGLSVTIWKTATQATSGSLDCVVDASVVTDGSSVSTVTFATTPYFDPSLLSTGLAGVSASAAASTGGFTLSAVRVTDVSCTVCGEWWIRTAKKVA